MSTAAWYQLLADAVLVVHTGVVAFVVFGLVIIVIGNLARWRWVNNLWFRLCHLAAIAFVVAASCLGLVCPLTDLEMWLRRQTGQTAYAGSFIQYWLQRILYYEAPAWVFTTVYTAFGLLVLASWLLFPPRRRRDAA
ncbi:MAG: DUF2784 domain-containing protein [Gammaproteobacteria bacterium]|nr:DUF2784 domain-containing protein [Gammaproteobacteria bacterium]